MKAFARRASRTSVKLIAAATCVAAAAPVHAQSSVSLYGQVDEWIGATKFPGGDRAWNVSGGGMSTSYWGLHGAEDLGNGYKAIFTLESFFRAQNGQFGRFQGDTFFARNAYVGVSSPYGTVTAGRLTTHLFLSTKAARGILKKEVQMSDFIWQTANLAGFISGCYTNDLDVIRASFEDVIIEKQRSQLIPGFDAVREGAMANGALGCTISGAGPSMFAWSLDADAPKVRDAMVAAFKAAGKETDAWIVPITSTGAHVVAP